MNILEDKWLRKIAKKSGKCVFLFKEQELEKVLEFRIYFSILEGVILLQLFPIPARS